MKIISMLRNIGRQTITNTKAEDKKVQILFSGFMIKWLDMIKHQVEESTYTGYKRQIEGRWQFKKT